jgi:hypothetical protein
MPDVQLRFIKRCAEWHEFTKEEVDKVPHNMRGIYVLFQKIGDDVYDVMYIGMAGSAKAGIRGRLLSHLQSRTKSRLCTHFSVFAVREEIDEEVVEELEGLIRHIFRKDRTANSLARQNSYGKLYKVRENDWSKWDQQG